MNNLITNMLYQLHYYIIDPATRVRYSVADLLESVRAVRDVSLPISNGERARANGSGYIPTREAFRGRTSGHSTERSAVVPCRC